MVLGQLVLDRANSMASTPILPPPTNYSLPPEEISALSQLCHLGDLDNQDVNVAFRRGLEVFERKNQSLCELWPVLLSAVQSARPKIIKLLLSRGLRMNEMYIRQAIKTRSKEVFEAFIENGWDVNETWDNVSLAPSFTEYTVNAVLT
jgi:hypothetical protein